MSMLVVREVSVRGGAAAVRGGSLAAEAGEVVGLVGDDGGSLLLRTLAGVLSPAAGLVRLAGEDVTGRSPAELAARGVALVPAGWRPFAGLTARENVLIGARGDTDAAEESLRLLPGAAEDERLLAVAVALVRRPVLLLVDGLPDAAARHAVVDALRPWRTSWRATALVAEPTAGRGPRELDGVAVYDRCYAVHGGTIRPWVAPDRLAGAC